MSSPSRFGSAALPGDGRFGLRAGVTFRRNRTFTIGRLLEVFSALTFSKKDPPLTRSLVRVIGRAFTTDDAAARRDLGYVGRVSRAEGLRLYGASAETSLR